MQTKQKAATNLGWQPPALISSLKGKKEIRNTTKKENWFKKKNQLILN